MAKVKRSVLKEIVKECLLEILFEGIDSESGHEEEPIRETRTRSVSRPSKNQQSQKSRKKELKSDHLHAAVSGLTDNPVMAAIYADTAATTLQEQKEGRRVPADNAAAAIDSVDNMEEVFPGAQNWAAIAFNEPDN